MPAASTALKNPARKSEPKNLSLTRMKATAKARKNPAADKGKSCHLDVKI